MLLLMSRQNYDPFRVFDLLNVGLWLPRISTGLHLRLVRHVELCDLLEICKLATKLQIN